ncbi:glutamate biosynthesis transcriptional regulator GltC [Staphylococcus ratti]|uniref:LysR family transcriptional regulator n=1 Tax=Staphylococcus ratti TaxID=2892440 RepID=A0ABY3PCK0_9STAP|nr:LysR family transcriptional regulator [Staphylococcus ratti]UEX89993.1 LysR family transcriptional regulator [Staphylococcus ratti]
MSLLELKQLKYFIEVAKREHISEAALELNVAQSAISRHISNLENELGTALFHRKGRNVCLTTEGKHLLQTALPILEQVEQTLAFFQTHQEIRSSTITIGYVDGAIGQILPQVLDKIESELEISLVPTLLAPNAIKQALDTNEIDIAITNANINDTLYTIQPLFEETYVLCGPSHHPLMTVPNPPLSHILKHQLYIHEPVVEDFKIRIETQAHLPVYRCNSTPFARFILQHEKGFVIAPSYINLYSHTHQWTKISLSHLDLKKTVSLVYRKENDKPAQHDIIAMLTSHLQQHSTYH